MKSSSDAIQLRSLRGTDLPFAMDLKKSAGWNQLEADWRFFIRHDSGGNFLALYNGEEAGTVTTLTYPGVFSWIGMVLVKPELRSRGIGTKLLEGAVDFARKKGTVGLDATPQGQKLYESLGFEAGRELVRVEHSGLKIEPHTECFSISISELENLAERDITVFGADRRFVLKYLLDNAPEYAHALRGKGRIKGYCFGRSGSRFEHVGPVVADSIDDAFRLLKTALASIGNRPVILDLFSDNSEWLELLKDLGFSIQRPLLRMYLGKWEAPVRADNQFAIAGPELG